MHINNTLHKAQLLFRNRQYSDVIALVAPLLEVNERQTDVNKILGMCYKALNKNSTALQYFLNSLKINDKQHDIHQLVGNIYKIMGMLELALRHYKQALSLGNNASYCNNIGFVYIQLKSLSLAEKYFQRSLDISPEQVNAKIGLASAYNLNNKELAAQSLLISVVDEFPDNFTAVYNLALLCKKLRFFEQSLHFFNIAQNLAPNYPGIYENLGFLYLENNDLVRSIQVFNLGLKLNPVDVNLNRALSRVLWEQGDKRFLTHYESLAIDEMPLALSIDYFYKLIQSGKLKQANRVVNVIEKTNNNSIPVVIARSQLHYENQAYLEGYTALKGLATNRALSPEELDWLGRHAFALGLFEEALYVYEQLLKNAPQNMGYWCLLSSALRELDHERYESLCSINSLVFIVDLELPPNYPSIGEFNLKLMDELSVQHVAEQHPLDQSLVSGTQTMGNIFSGSKGTIKDLAASLNLTANRTLSQLTKDENHPVLKHAKSEFKFSGAWSVWLKSAGYHKNHFHSEGWYSGVYYVNTPNDLTHGEGYLKLGQSDIALPNQPDAEFYIKPKAGQLVLFPSFMWHGTVPFKSKTPRVTVAFDITPL